ncbi:unnamed protein product [Psylliodes chrysocephalus]|uniref:Uncharacterized protein n=1 Tax=Psylliodes chrysocephalus TaxID=3402493 RepID=A0A9P0CHA7_9CUCU|nr:unnamed protein product [Psylliodes chrysocephala]
MKKAKDFLRGPQIKKKRTTAPADKEYGMLDNNILNLEERKQFLDSLPNSKAEVLEIEIKTRGQARNTCWRLYRIYILTASNFGTICKLKKTTDPKKTVHIILFSSITNSKATTWGKDHESHAKEAFKTKFQKKVKYCGLFIYDKLPFLDGVINTSEIIEIKSFLMCHNDT